MRIFGKGYYLWQLPYCDSGDAQAIAARARAANLSHAMIKIADGSTWPYNFDFNQNIDLIPPVREALRQVGVSVWGWHYVRGDDPINEGAKFCEFISGSIDSSANLQGSVIVEEVNCPHLTETLPTTTPAVILESEVFLATDTALTTSKPIPDVGSPSFHWFAAHINPSLRCERTLLCRILRVRGYNRVVEARL